jgi:hypothetical protein
MGDLYHVYVHGQGGFRLAGIVNASHAVLANDKASNRFGPNAVAVQLPPGQAEERLASLPPVVLIACCKGKLDYEAPARDLYTGDLFRKSVAYAEHRGLRWAVLSAAYGVVQPDVPLSPYDVTLLTMSRRQREDWGIKVSSQIQLLFPLQTFVVLAGRHYRTIWTDSVVCEFPLQGMGIGRQKQWLMRQVQEVRP